MSTKEFVVNFATTATRKQMNLSSKDIHKDDDEFILTKLKMKIVKAHEVDKEGYKKIGKRFDIPAVSAANIIKTYKKKKALGLDPFEVIKPGRNRKTTARTDRDIVIKAKKNPRATLRYYILHSTYYIL